MTQHTAPYYVLVGLNKENQEFEILFEDKNRDSVVYEKKDAFDLNKELGYSRMRVLEAKSSLPKHIKEAVRKHSDK